MNRTYAATGLDVALFGTDWDASVCEQNLAARVACLRKGDPLAPHYLQNAIQALQGAKASLATAERFAATLKPLALRRAQGGRR